MNDDLPLEGRQILAVEDRYLLERDGCEWVEETAATGLGPAPDAAASRLIEARTFDFAAVDIHLGHDATYELTGRRLREPAPFLSSAGCDEAATPERLKGAQKLEKPFKGPDVVRARRALPFDH